jgi:hypothetical protein
MYSYINIKVDGFNKIKYNIKTIEIRKKTKYTNVLENKKYVYFKNNNEIIKKKIKKIIPINNLFNFLKSIDINMTGYNDITKYTERLNECYTNINNIKFIAIYI